MRSLRRNARSVAVVVLLLGVPGVGAAALALADAGRNPGGPAPVFELVLDPATGAYPGR